jgi:hypothetical protein
MNYLVFIPIKVPTNLELYVGFALRAERLSWLKSFCESLFEWNTVSQMGTGDYVDIC